MYGLRYWQSTENTYCVNDTSASDYGKCYNIEYGAGKAIFVQTDIDKYSTLRCESEGTCIRYTYTRKFRILNVVFDGTSTGKQAIVYAFRTLTHSSAFINRMELFEGLLVFSLNRYDEFGIPGSKLVVDFFFSGGYYDPLNNVVYHINRYTVPYGTVVDLYWSGQILTQYIDFNMPEYGKNNIWYAGHGAVQFAYEASPLLIMPLDYVDDYLVYPELRKVVAYAGNGVDQAGWNADDILRVVQELFPDRPWLVYDVDNATVYSNGLDIDDVAELSNYVDVLDGTYTLYVLNTNIPKKKVQEFINFYKRQYAIQQST